MPRNPHDESLIQSLKEFSVLLNRHEFTRALPIARSLLTKYPDDFLVYQACSVCYLELGRHADALKTLKKGLARFPDNCHLLYFAAQTLERLQRYEEAEQSYRKAIAKTPPADHGSLSESFNGLGVALWMLHRRDEALEMWRKAVKEDPSNRMAVKNIDEFTNPYGEPSAPSGLFDDLYHFQNLHSRRYLDAHEKNQFDSEEELFTVLDAITEAWNEQIAPLGDKVDRMTPAEKSALFFSTVVNFEPRSKTPTDVRRKTKRRKK